MNEHPSNIESAMLYGVQQTMGIVHSSLKLRPDDLIEWKRDGQVGTVTCRVLQVDEKNNKIQVRPLSGSGAVHARIRWIKLKPWRIRKKISE